MSADYDAALKLALKRLQSADKLEAELRQMLNSAGFEPETITNVLSFLKDRRFVDDRRTIENHIEKRSGRRSMGKEKIRAELIARGAPEELIEDCLKASTAGDEMEMALAALRGKFSNPPDRGKAGRFLAGRGFEGELIETALDRFFESNDPV